LIFVVFANRGEPLSLSTLYAIDPKTFDVVSVDVFDTTLLRDNKGQRRRFAEVAAEFSRSLGRDGHAFDIGLLFKLRLMVHGLAYQAVAIERPAGDATLARMQKVQCLLLGLDPSHIAQMQEAELAVERRSLSANRRLIDWLDAMHAEGKPVIAISDIYLPTTIVSALLSEKAGLAIQRTYVSSDLGLTKRSGKLFADVAAIEGIPLARMLHCGDHPRSDVAMPLAAGMQAAFLPRPPLQRAMRKISSLAAALTEPRIAPATSKPPCIRDRRDFGRQILGPIFAEFALKTWTLLSGLEHPDDSVLLFCARGGLRLQAIYQKFLVASGLTSPVAIKPLMISRIVAVRSSLLKGGAAAFEQIGHEFRGRSLRDVARAIGCIEPDQANVGSGAIWDAPYSRQSLEALLASPAGQPFLSATANQDSLFREHLEDCTTGRSRAILCDTGLFASTLQLLEEAVPEKQWSCVQFARANYKQLPTPHFGKVVGIATHDDRYSPFNSRTSILRYWHLIEATLEPELPSARSFTRVEGVARSNLEIDGWSQRIAPEQDELFAGILDYIGALRPADATTRIMTDVETAFRCLHRAVVWPTRNDARLLDFPPRSVDFGKDGHVPVIARGGGLVQAVRTSEWREGAIAEMAIPLLRLPLLAAVEAAFSARWLYRLVRSQGAR
jgi:FMN phosphatase YigB (HAD superfamily)